MTGPNQTEQLRAEIARREAAAAEAAAAKAEEVDEAERAAEARRKVGGPGLNGGAMLRRLIMLPGPSVHLPTCTV